jgi:hypothetical protein
MTIDQFITEQVLGECWHESSGMTWICGNCKTDIGWKGSNANSVAVKTLNNDFSTPEGFFKLWNFSREQDWWSQFVLGYIRELDSALRNLRSQAGGQQVTKLHDPLEVHLVNTIVQSDTFANAIARFRGWKEGE